VPHGPDVDLVMDNYASLARTPPTLACSLHADVGLLHKSGRTVDRRADAKAIATPVHRSTAELEADLDPFIETHNGNPHHTSGSNPPIKYSRRPSASAKKQ